MTPAEAVRELPTVTADGGARAAAFDALGDGLGLGEPGGAVSYISRGRVLVIGSLDAAAAVARRLPGELKAHVLATDEAGERPGRPDVGGLGARLVRARLAGLDGHLGAFHGRIHDRGGTADLGPLLGLAPHEPFDVVVDLGTAPALLREKGPPGYFNPVEADALEATLAVLPDWVGELEKPQYFAYEPEICVHGSRGQAGCNRCLDHCATEAIRSAGERIEVDPYLCLGCGSCATVCPTGAIGYTAPSGEAFVDALRRLLRHYREAGGSRPVVLVHDTEAGATALADWGAMMPESVLPVAVEDTGGVGPDAWLAALAFGAARVVLAVPAETPASERAATDGELAVAREVLAGLELPPDRIATLTLGGDETPLSDAPEPLVAEPATFAAFGGKRARMRWAIDHLYRQGGASAPTRSLPAGAPFGAISVDAEACTLCMACVSVCPTHAVTGGGDTPRLDFREDRCVQCGICERACPEDAIALAPQIDYAAQSEAHGRVLNEAPMHHCPECGKAFAPRAVIERMEERLASHWMFGDEAARHRLRLCEDCRVKAVLRDEGSINPYR